MAAGVTIQSEVVLVMMTFQAVQVMTGSMVEREMIGSMAEMVTTG